MPIDLMVLMADIIPTGYSVAKNALTLLQGDGAKSREKTVCVVIGCGPVSDGLEPVSRSSTDTIRWDSAQSRQRAPFSTRCMQQTLPSIAWKPQNDMALSLSRRPH